MKDVLIESAYSVRILGEKADGSGDKTLTVEVKWQQADRINLNRRRYSRKVLENAIAAIAPKITGGEVWGSSFHPEDGIGEVDDISHIWKEVSMRPDGACVGVVEVLPTTRGKNVQKILRKGKIGMSSRGKGTLVQRTEVVEGREEKFEDVADFRLYSPGDFTLAPSVIDAGPLHQSERLIKVEGLSVYNFGDLTPDELRITGAASRKLGR
jgi:hypothetical protein